MADKMPDRGMVFISYSHRDQVWKDRLIRHLGRLRREGLLTTLDEGEEETDSDLWPQEIERVLEQARVAVLFVSEDYLSSGFIRRMELPRLLERAKKGVLHLVPLLVRPCMWKEVPWLRDLEVQPYPSEPLSSMRQAQQEKILSRLALQISELLGDPGLGKAPSAAEPRVSISRLPTVAGELFGREAELKALDDIWESPQIRIVSIAGLGGIGKTALVSHWLSRMARDRFRGAERVFGWSFSGRSGIEDFLAEALRFFGEPRPTDVSPGEQVERLTRWMSDARTLLVLDGIETFQDARGRLHPGVLDSLLRRLAVDHRGLVLLISRIPLPEDWVAPRTPIDPHPHLPLSLGGLPPEAGAALLRTAGVRGSESELAAAHLELGGHPLALTLLARALRERSDGEVRRREELSGLVDGGPDAEPVARLVEDYSALLTRSERALLHLFGLFDRPATRSELAALCKPPIAELTDVPDLELETGRTGHLRTLIDLGLLALDEPGATDGPIRAHPLIRQSLRQRLRQERPEAFRQGHERLFRHLSTAASGLPETLEEMAPTIHAVAHGCAAGLTEESLSLYRKLIARGDSFYLSRSLSAPETDLLILTPFFESPWDRPRADLDRQGDALRVLKAAGHALLSAGRLREARAPFTELLQRTRELRDWSDAIWAGRRLSEAQLYLGDIGQALVTAQEAVELADAAVDQDRRTVAVIALADVLHQAGRLQEAGQIVEGISLASYRYFNLQLSLGRARPMLKPISDLRLRAERARHLPRAALAHLALGRAQMEMEEDLESAGTHFDRAVEILRQGGAQSWYPVTLIARATFRLRLGERLEEARQDLTEALEHATRRELRLHEADAHLAFTRLHLATGDPDRARQSLSLARAIVDETGYHRRDGELQELEGRLSAVAAESAADPVALAFRLVLAGHATPDLLLHPDLRQIEEAARRLSDEPGDPLLRAQHLLEKQQPGVIPNPLWAAWVAALHGKALQQPGRRGGA